MRDQRTHLAVPANELHLGDMVYQGTSEFLVISLAVIPEDEQLDERIEVLAADPDNPRSIFSFRAPSNMALHILRKG